MGRIARYRVALFAAVSALFVVTSAVPASAAVDMVDGVRSVVPHQPITDCSAKAKTALNSVLTNAFEAGAGTNQWMAYGTPDSGGHSSTAAAIHCFPVNDGYVVTLTCAVETQTSPDSAAALCTKLATAFGIQSTTSALTTSHAGGTASWH